MEATPRAVEFTAEWNAEVAAELAKTNSESYSSAHGVLLKSSPH